MTHAELCRRGQRILFICLAVFVGAMALSDWQWGGLLTPDRRTLLRYAITIALGVFALRGRSWAVQLLAGLIGAGVLYGLFHAASVGSALPRLAVWLIAHAAINVAIAAVLVLSPSIARYQSSKNELVMP